MNVLFLTIGRMEDIDAHGIYPDLLRQFREHGHHIFVVSPSERRTGKKTELVKKTGVQLLHVKIGNITKCGTLEKGISTVQIEAQFKSAIQRYFHDVKFDLVLYSTPPITLVGVVRFIKKRDGAKSYLLLKDIFPQNAVDLGMMSKTGWKGIVYRYFRAKEKRLYALSDVIGCMSQANMDYTIKHNPEINPGIVEVCPNSIEVRDLRLTQLERDAMREKYGIPLDKKVFVYGGNLGKPQGIPFLMECLKVQQDNKDAYFLIVGDGTEFIKLEAFFEKTQPQNMKLMNRLPKEDYDRMIAACDVGMIFLDHRFTIPNFPSRLLAYMQAGLPVLACTDPNTDIGRVIVEGGFGWWCESNDAERFADLVRWVCREDLTLKSQKSAAYLLEHFSVKESYRAILHVLEAGREQ